MWTDDYTDTFQCGSASGPTPSASKFYGPTADAQFGRSIAGVVFPRASVAAGSFWTYVPGLSAEAAAFVSLMELQNSRMVARGLDTCPNNCTCDYLTRCGKPY